MPGVCGSPDCCSGGLAIAVSTLFRQENQGAHYNDRISGDRRWDRRITVPLPSMSHTYLNPPLRRAGTVVVKYFQ